ncbi:Uncharacterised protein [Mycobacteroides abscessus subsp. abscessus]|nr:Uncharacterised protein [Mycobacteroides abscessus subsp. abscessus]
MVADRRHHLESQRRGDLRATQGASGAGPYDQFQVAPATLVHHCPGGQHAAHVSPDQQQASRLGPVLARGLLAASGVDDDTGMAAQQ